MIKEALQYLAERFKAADGVTVHDRAEVEGNFVDRSVTLVKPNPPDAITVYTLTAVLDFIGTLGKDNIDAKDVTVIVGGPRDVSVMLALDDYGDRHQLAKCSPLNDDLADFIGRQHEPENFVVALMTRFQASDERAALLAQIGQITVGDVRTLADDGVTQEVTTKTGAARVGTTAIKNPVSLIPLRSFPEVQLAPVPYVLRATARQDRTPLLALHECDGGQWRIDAVNKIASLLSKQLGNSIPVIA